MKRSRKHKPQLSLAAPPQPAVIVATPPSEDGACESHEWLDLSEHPSPSESIDFLLTPYTLERTILFGMLVAADSFIFTLAILPFRVIFSVIASFTRWLLLLDNKKQQQQPAITPTNKVNLMRLFLVVACCVAVWRLDLTSLGVLVRRSEMRLKMVWMCMEFLDKMLVSWGRSILGSLFWNLCVTQGQRKWSVVTQTVVAFLYLALHCSLLLIHLSVLNTAVTSGNGALLSVVILVQFAEMKSLATKTVDRSKLEARTDEDIQERFQLFVFILYLFAHNNQWLHWMPLTVQLFVDSKGKEHVLGAHMSSFYSGLAIIYFSELVVDWIKHCAVCQTSNVLPGFYLTHTEGLAKDATEGGFGNPLIDGSLKLSRRMGIWPLPLIVILAKLTGDCLNGVKPAKIATIVVYGWLTLVVLRLVIRSLVFVMSKIHPFKFVDKWLQLRDFVPEKKKKS